ncbi:intracellular PHB depolymerase [Fulvimarina pelagi HTCC2506]|uniref:Intracellular PHB depolymerase n=1 Tax=Fulvimarina pelagi HTCC2506 TaxID=314231 RepID=Q0G493_9HYPH|nr:intracellular PHB depolymerase [Fulvimarina pelagi HTCC2506]
MLYYFYEWNQAMLAPLRVAADATRIAYQNPLNPASRTTVGRAIAAGAELFERTTRVYAKPEFGIEETVVGHSHVRVKEKVVVDKPFCQLLHFERQLPKDRKSDPRFIVVAPLSGHHATLLRGTVEALLPYADVYITDWQDAREVPVEDGKFDLDDYTQYIIDFLHFLGPDTHILGVCQPSVPVMMAVAHMEKHQDECYPATMTLMGGPIDTRVNPTAVNRLAEEKGIDWFRDNVIMTVPFPQLGFRRAVYPGFLQLTGFMSMNLDRHMMAHKDFFWHLVKDDGDSAEKHRIFYDEYNAVMDMTAEFYLQTVEEVFIKHSLPKGEMKFNGETIDLGAIKRVALLTVEGENDDISGVGQTEAAQDICPNIPEEMRVHYVQPKVGHYGVFNGSRFRAEIVPRIIDFALTHGTTHGSAELPKRTEVTKRAGRNFGAFAERHAKAGMLGQSLGAGGETGIADPLMFESNPFAAGERIMRVFAEPAEKALAETMKQAKPAKKAVETAKAPAKAAKSEAKPAQAKTASNTQQPAKDKSEATGSDALKPASAKSETNVAAKSGTSTTSPANKQASQVTRTEAKASDQSKAEAKQPSNTETQSAPKPAEAAKSASAKVPDQKPASDGSPTTSSDDSKAAPVEKTTASAPEIKPTQETKSDAPKTGSAQPKDAKTSNASANGSKPAEAKPADASDANAVSTAAKSSDASNSTSVDKTTAEAPESKTLTETKPDAPKADAVQPSDTKSSDATSSGSKPSDVSKPATADRNAQQSPTARADNTETTTAEAKPSVTSANSDTPEAATKKVREPAAAATSSTAKRTSTRSGRTSRTGNRKRSRRSTGRGKK